VYQGSVALVREGHGVNYSLKYHCDYCEVPVFLFHWYSICDMVGQYQGIFGAPFLTS
jgi:hypothetical protein